MVASVILTVGFLGMIQALTIGTETLDISRKQQAASQLIDYEMERLRTSAWSTITGTPWSGGTIAISTAGTISGDETRFALSNFSASNTDDNTALSARAPGFRVTYVRTAVRSGYYKFVFTVTWISNTGRSYTREVQSYLSENGLHLAHQRS